jgi:hypothetical protein
MLELAKYRLREMIDLRGCEDDDRNIRLRPRFGRVEPSGGADLFRLADNLDTGRITPHTAVPDDGPPETMMREDVDHYDIDASTALRQDATSEILHLAAAPKVAWSPHGSRGRAG